MKPPECYRDVNLILCLETAPSLKTLSAIGTLISSFSFHNRVTSIYRLHIYYAVTGAILVSNVTNLVVHVIASSRVVVVVVVAVSRLVPVRGATVVRIRGSSSSLRWSSLMWSSSSSSRSLASCRSAEPPLSAFAGRRRRRCGGRRRRRCGGGRCRTTFLVGCSKTGESCVCVSGYAWYVCVGVLFRQKTVVWMHISKHKC